MRNFDIKTTLSLCPSFHLAHEVIYITRGATATLNFNFGNKLYGFEDTDQITFILEQGKNTYWYKMFTYLIETEDNKPIEGKTYYTDVKPIDDNEETYQCTGTEVSSPSGNPKELGYYEVVDGNYSWRNTKYIVDQHFNQSSGIGYDYISLVLSSKETSYLYATTPEDMIKFEVVIRLNTDNFASLGNNDSIIIEPQHPIGVINSLYAKLEG